MAFPTDLQSQARIALLRLKAVQPGVSGDVVHALEAFLEEAIAKMKGIGGYDPESDERTAGMAAARAYALFQVTGRPEFKAEYDRLASEWSRQAARTYHRAKQLAAEANT